MKNPLVRKVLGYYNRLNLNKKFLVTLLGITILPVFFLQSISFFAMDQIARQQIEDFTSARIQQSYNAMDTLFGTYDSLLLELTQDSLILEEIKNINEWGPRYRQSMAQIRQQVLEKSTGVDGLLGVAVVAENNTLIFYDQITYSNLESYCFPADAKQYRDARLPGDTTQLRYTSGGTLSSDRYGERQVLYLSYPIIDHQKLQPVLLGSVVFAVEEDFVESKLQQSHTPWHGTFLINSKGDILTYQGKSYNNKNIYTLSGQRENQTQALHDTVQQSALLHAQDLRIHSVSFPTRDVTLVDVLDGNYISRPWRLMVTFIVLFGALAIGIALLVIQHTSFDIQSKVEVITHSMEQTNQGDLSVRADIPGEDEFAVIAQQFNLMLAAMQTLRNAQTQMAESLKAAEITALESQINPHFIYNTLDSINWLAIQNEEYEISYMLKNLGNILRYSVHQSTKIVPLEEELTYLRQYLTLQQQRYRYSFTSMISVEPGLERVLIPKMLIQPLIENTLLHGFPHTEEDMVQVTIRPTGTAEQPLLSIRVEDNGKGISPTVAEELNRYRYTQQRDSNHIGLRNIISRIQIYYEDSGSVQFSPRPTGGTIVAISLPITEQGEDME